MREWYVLELLHGGQDEVVLDGDEVVVTEQNYPLLLQVPVIHPEREGREMEGEKKRGKRGEERRERRREEREEKRGGTGEKKRGGREERREETEEGKNRIYHNPPAESQGISQKFSLYIVKVDIYVCVYMCVSRNSVIQTIAWKINIARSGSNSVQSVLFCHFCFLGKLSENTHRTYIAVLFFLSYLMYILTFWSKRIPEHTIARLSLVTSVQP